MKKLTDQQADALRDEGKIVLRVSSSESVYYAILIAILATGATFLLLRLESYQTWLDYAEFVLFLLLWYGPAIFIFIAGRRVSYVLDERGITAQRIFSKKHLYWKEIKFVGYYSGRRSMPEIIVSVLPLPDGEVAEDNNRISRNAYFHFIADPQTIIIPSLTNDFWAPQVIEMWKKHRNQQISPVVDESRYRDFPRKPR